MSDKGAKNCVTLLGLALVCGCRGSDPDNLEEKILQTLRERKESGDLTSLKLRELSNRRTERLCIQSPYIDEGSLERIVKSPLPGFVPISDDKYVWWVSFGGDTWQRVEVSRADLMNRHQTVDAACVTGPDITIQFVEDRGSIEYQVREN